LPDSVASAESVKVYVMLQRNQTFVHYTFTGTHCQSFIHTFIGEITFQKELHLYGIVCRIV